MGCKDRNPHRPRRVQQASSKRPAAVLAWEVVEFFESRYLCTARGGRGKEDEAGTRTLDEAHAVECDASRDPPRSRIIAGTDAQVSLTHLPSLVREMHLHWVGGQQIFLAVKKIPTKTRGRHSPPLPRA